MRLIPFYLSPALGQSSGSFLIELKGTVKRKAMFLYQKEDWSGDVEREVLEARSALEDAVRQEDVMIQEKARICWLKDGDCNSKFFHEALKANRIRARVNFVSDDEEGELSDAQIKAKLTSSPSSFHVLAQQSWECLANVKFKYQTESFNWLPPQQGILKFNVDGAWEEENMRTGICCIARDFSGLVWLVNAESLEGMHISLEVEGKVMWMCLEHPIVEIKVTNNIRRHQLVTLTCFEGDVILNGPMHLAYHEFHIVLCRIRIMGVSCRCEVSSSVWIEAKNFSAYKYHRDHHLCVGDKCSWYVRKNGVTLADPAFLNRFALLHSAQEGIKFYNWDDAM
ncbi:hypothetical protein QQ045_008531 [Rhodiola kirilowii]